MAAPYLNVVRAAQLMLGHPELDSPNSQGKNSPPRQVMVVILKFSAPIVPGLLQTENYGVGGGPACSCR